MVGDSELVAYEINHLVIHKLRHEQVEYRRGVSERSAVATTAGLSRLRSASGN